jgi:subtilisin family serine protease
MKKAFVSVLILCLFASSLLTLSSVAAASSVKIPVLIGFKGVPDAAMVHAFGGEIKYSYEYVQAIAASIPAQAIDALKRNPHVAYVEPDAQAYALGEVVPWGIDRIEADLAWSSSIGDGIRVAIVDTGIDVDHEDLSVVGGASFVSYTTSYDDDYGHGTHCAGTVTAVDNEVGVIGVAPNVLLYAVKVLDWGGYGLYSDIVAGLEWCITNEIQVVSMSFGGSSSDATLEAVCNTAYNHNMVLVAAAGNSGNRPGKGDNVEYPAGYASVIAVAATDSNDKRASFSSTGLAVELAAPGVNVLSTLPGGYGLASGTSMACPHVAGTAALVLAENPGISNVEVREILQNTAEDLGSAGRDELYGYGLVRADLAVGTIPPDVPTGNIVGTVLNTEAVAVQGATVTVEGTQLSTTTDVNGAYSLANVPAGEQSITVAAGGYYSQTATATVQEDTTVTLDFTLEATPPVQEGTVQVSSIDYSTVNTKHLIVKISLIDENGAGVSGASVSIDVYRNSALYDTAAGTSGDDGTVTFRYNNSPSGTYTTEVLDVTAAGYTWDGITPPNSISR